MHTVHENLPAGLYVLTQDVTNPEPDRRCKDNWVAAETWEKGRFFRVQDHVEDQYAPGRVSVEICSGRYRRIYSGFRRINDGVKSPRVECRDANDYKQACALVPHIQPVPLNLGNVQQLYPDSDNYRVSDVLRELARRGLLTESQALDVFLQIAKHTFFPSDDED